MDNDFDKLLDFYEVSNNLNKVFRYSEYKELSNTQSTASHSWRLSLMTLTLAKELNLDIDVDKAVKIAIVHDIAESITGDVDYSKVYTNKISVEEKSEAEKNAIFQLKKSLSLTIGNEIEDLWKEYEHKNSDEAKFVYALDKIEALIYICEAGKPPHIPDMIARYADKSVENYPLLKPFLKSVKNKLKILFEKHGIIWKKEYDLV